MKKTLTLMLAMVIGSSFGLAGCSKGESKVEKPQAAETSAESQKPADEAKTGEPIKLRITWWGSQTRHDYTQKLLDLYTEKNPHVTFEATPAGWDGYFEKLSAEAAGDMMPDIIQMDYAYLGTFTKNDTLADLKPFVDSKVLDMSKVDENLSASGIIDDKLTGAVISSSTLAYTYNPEIFKQAGVAEPTAEWTWAEFEKSMISIKEKTGLLGVGKLEETNYFPYWVRQNGATLFSADGKKLGYEDDKIFVEFTNMLGRLQDADAMPNPDEWLQIASKGKESEPVVTGEGASTFDWSNFSVIAEKTNPNLKLMLPPADVNHTKALWVKPGMFFSVSKSSKNQEEAAKFINWFMNDEEANKIIMSERGVPVSSEIREKIKPELTAKQQEMFDFIDLAMQNASKIDPAEPAGVAEVRKVLTDCINKVLYKQDSAEKAAAEFREKANDILGRS